MTFIIESVIIGRPMASLLHAALFKRGICRRHFEIAEKILSILHSSTESSRVTFNDAAIEKYLIAPMNYYCKILKIEGKYITNFISEIHARAKTLTGDPVPVVLTHGDLHHCNILLDQAEIGLIDWEWSKLQALPFMDIFEFPTMYGIGLTKLEPLKAFIHTYLNRNWYHNLVSELFTNYCINCGVDRNMIEIFLPLYFLKQGTTRESDWPNFFQLLAKRGINKYINSLNLKY